MREFESPLLRQEERVRQGSFFLWYTYGMQPGEQDTPEPEYVNTGNDGNDAPSSSIAWEASEYLQHNNGTGWYIGFFVVAAVLITFAIILRAWTFIPVVIVMAIAGIIHVRRPPRVLRYELSDAGLQIGDRLHPYGDYKSFSVIRDGAFFAILLMPAKRFSPSTIVYFDEADGEAIVDAFGTRLPMEHHDLDSLERFLRLIRF